MARVSYYTTPLLRSLVHRPQGVILVLLLEEVKVFLVVFVMVIEIFHLDWE